MKARSLLKELFLDRYNVVFGVHPNSLEILQTPTDFFSRLQEGISTAKERIYLSTLYTGSEEKNQILANHLNDQLQNNSRLRHKILLDAQRGTRLSKNICSLSLFSESILSNVYLFQTPLLHGFWKSIVPPRINEIFGTQHMKLYIFDNDVIISGANLSHDYFTNRQDRYWVFKNNARLANYFAGLVDTVSEVSYRCKNTKALKNVLSSLPFDSAKKNQNLIFQHFQTSADCPSPIKHYVKYGEYGSHLVNTWISSQRSDPEGESFDSYIVPTIQMGCFGIRNDQVLFEQFLSQFNQNNTIHLATAYFNLAPELAEQIYRSQAHWKVLTAAPQANGFFNSGGVSRYIPGAYLDREYQFLRHKPEKADIQMFEWFKEGETFHAKGLWSSTEQLGTYLSICGSSNWGKRSIERDIEAQVVLVTTDPGVQKQLDNEIHHIFDPTNEVTHHNFFAHPDRHVPFWLPLLSSRFCSTYL